MKHRRIALALVLLIMASAVFGCAKQETVAPSPEVVPEDKVTLTIAGGWTECRALDEAAKAFTAEYPNCTIVYEYLQDYNESVVKRLSGEEQVDMFFATNIQADSPFLPYAFDFNSSEDIDLSQAFYGLIENFTFRGEDGDRSKIYCLPLGAEMRGMFINKTLLDSVGIPIPTDQASFLSACQTLKDKGYIPLHGNPGNFAQVLLYPWICSSIANADDPQEAYDTVNAHAPGVSEMFSAPLEFLYLLVENYYFDYKTAQTELNLFNETTDEDYARFFLNIEADGDSWKKVDDVGQIAFMPAALSLNGLIEKTRDDYHSEIEYVFVPSPIGPEGGYAYMSPAHGIAVNKNGANLKWVEKFIDFLFQPENNKAFAQSFNVIPNTKEAFEYITTLYDIPNNRICHLGQVTFDYNLYTAILPTLVDISKANNPKYMQDDGSGNLSLYPLSHFTALLEETLTQQ